MSAMNSVAIVDDFKDGLAEEVLRIKARMADMIVDTIEASAEAKLPVDMEPSVRYQELVNVVQSEMSNTCLIHDNSVEDRVNAAAALLFESYD